MSMTKPISGTLLLVLVAMGSVHSAERPTLNHTGDPRPDILPHPFYYAHTEYRREYNRPRDISGWIANKIAPSSLEAMVWNENVQAGNYDEKHMPPMYKRYCYPKPWEVLNTGPRPDFPRSLPPGRGPATQPGPVDQATVPLPRPEEALNVVPAPESQEFRQPNALPPIPVPQSNSLPQLPVPGGPSL